MWTDQNPLRSGPMGVSVTLHCGVGAEQAFQDPEPSVPADNTRPGAELSEQQGTPSSRPRPRANVQTDHGQPCLYPGHGLLAEAHAGGLKPQSVSPHRLPRVPYEPDCLSDGRKAAESG